MKRILLVCLTVFTFCNILADLVPGVVINTKSDDSSVVISRVSSISHSNGSMIINQTDGKTTSINISDIKEWKYDMTESSDTTVVKYNDFDVNMDGAVNAADVVAIYNFILIGENSGILRERADANKDNNINAADVVSVYNYIEYGNNPASEEDINTLYLHMANGQEYTIGISELDSITFDNDAASMYLVTGGKNNELKLNEFLYATYGTEVSTVCITYDGDTTHIINPSFLDGVAITTNKADVTVNSTSDNKIEYTLDGSSDDGDFKIYSSKKYQVTMKGLTLSNADGPVINSQSSKEATIKSQNGYINTLSDGTTYAKSNEDQKACIFSEGQIIFKGAGELIVNGNNKHGICSDDYIEISNSSITVNSVSDAIHANDSVLITGGKLTLNPTNDGIDCEGPVYINATSQEEADNITIKVTGSDNSAIKSDSLITIVDANIGITTTGSAAKGFKSKGDINVLGGNITTNQTGNKIVAGEDISYAIALKAGNDINISNGILNLTNKADGGRGLSADKDVNITGGNISIEANGDGGVAETTKDDSGNTDDEPTQSYVVYVSLPTTGTSGGFNPGGSTSAYWTTVYLYKSDGTQVAQLTKKKTVTASNGTSTSFYYYDFKQSDSGTYYFKSADYRSSRGGTYTIISKTISGPTSGTDTYYSLTNSYTTSGTTRTFTINNVTSTYTGGTSDVSEDNGTAYNASCIKADSNVTLSNAEIRLSNNGKMSKSIKSKGTVTINSGKLTCIPSGAMQVINSDASYSSAIKTNYYVGNGGIVNITASGAASRGISANNSLIINDGTYTITNSGAGSTGSNNTNYTAKAFTSDGDINIAGGDITINMSGSGGKGIKSDKTITIGKSDEQGPVLNVTTTGSSLGGSSSGGGGGWGGPQQSSGGSSSKAIKAQGVVTVNGGEMNISTSTDGAEGLESKTSISINGGKHYFKCYDDCINSSGNIYFNGGITVCYGYGNDAVDSNAGRTGAITIGNGTVLAYTTKGSPEEGLDCDNNSYIQITGKGIAISAGGTQGGSSSSSISNAAQGYNLYTSTISYTSGRYYTLADSSGKNLVTYSFPSSISSTLNLITATGMTSGQSYNIKYSTTEPTDATTAFHGLYLGSSATGTTSVATFTAK